MNNSSTEPPHNWEKLRRTSREIQKVNAFWKFSKQKVLGKLETYLNDDQSQGINMIGKEIKNYLNTYRELKKYLYNSIDEHEENNKSNDEFEAAKTKNLKKGKNKKNKKKVSNKIHNMQTQSTELLFKNLGKSDTVIIEETIGENDKIENNDKNEKQTKSIQLSDFLLTANSTSKKFINEPFFKLTPKTEKIKKEIRTLALSPNQKYLAAGLMNGEVHIFDLASGKDKADKIKTMVKDKNIAVYDLSFSPKGKYILLGGAKGNYGVIDFNNDSDCAKYTGVLSIAMAIRIVKFSADGNWIFLGSDDGNLKCFKFDAEKFNKETFSEERTIISHLDGVCAFDYSGSIKKYASGGNDKILNIFSLDKNYNLEKEKQIIIKIHKGIIRSIAFSNNGAFVLTGSYDMKARLFDSNLGTLIMTYEGHTKPLFSVSLCPQGKYVLTGSQDNTAKLFDRLTGERLAEYCDEDKESEIRCVRFFRSGSTLITAGVKGVINFFSIREGSLHRHNSRHSEEVVAIDFSPDGKALATGTESGSVKMFEIRTGIELWSLSYEERAVVVVKFSPDGTFLFSGGEDCIVRIFDVIGGVLVNSIDGHREYISSIIFMKDRPEFATSSADRTIQVYDYYSHEKKYSFPKNRGLDDIQIFSLAYEKDYIFSIGENDKNNSNICLYKLPGIDELKADQSENKSKENEVKYFDPNDETLNHIFVFKDKNISVIYNIIYSTKSSIFIVEFNEKTSVFLNIFTFNNKVLKLEASNEEINSLAFHFNEDTHDLHLIMAIKILDKENGGDSLIKEAIFNLKKKENLEPKSLKLLPQTGFGNISAISTLKIENTSSLKVGFATSLGTALLYERSLNKNEEDFKEIRFSQFSEEIVDLDIYTIGLSGAILSKDKTLRIINTLSGEVEIEDQFKNNITCLKFCEIEEAVDTLEGILICGGEGLAFEFYGFPNKNKIHKDNPIFSGDRKMIFLECKAEEGILNIFCGLSKESEDLKYSKASNDFSESNQQTSKETKESKDSGTLVEFYHLQYKIEQSWLKPKNNYNLLNINHSQFKSNIKLIFPYFGSNEDDKGLYLLNSKGSLLKQPLQNDAESVIIFPEFKEDISCANSNHDHSKIITGDLDGVVKVFELDFLKEKSFQGHKTAICAVSFLCEVSYAISASIDNIVILFEIETLLPIQTFKNEAKILKIKSSFWIDSVLLGTKTGLNILFRVLNTRKSIDQFDRLYKRKEIPLTTKELVSLLNNQSFDMIPICPNITILCVIISALHKDSPKVLQVLKVVVDTLYNADVSENTKFLLAQSIFRSDSVFKKSAWDIWVESLDKKEEKRIFLEKLIRILTYPDIDGVALIQNKYKFLKLVAEEFPGHMKSVLDSFWSPTSTISLKYHRMDRKLYFDYYLNKIKRILIPTKIKKKNRIVFPMVLQCTSYSTSPRILEKKYEEFCESLLENDQANGTIGYIDCEIRSSEITFDEIIKTDKIFNLSIFREYVPEDNVFKSELLAVIVDYLWRLESFIGVKFYKRLIRFLVLQMIITTNSLIILPNREMSISKCQNIWISLSYIFDGSLIIIFFVRFMYKVKTLKNASENAKFNNSRLFNLRWWVIDYIISSLAVITFSLDFHYANNFHDLEDTEQRIIAIKCLLAIVFALSWFRLIEFALGIKKTSALVRILEKVTQDMLVFLVIILLMIVVFGFSIFILQDSYGYYGPWTYFKTIYYILIGDIDNYNDFEHSLNTDLYFILLFITTVYLVIIMLNLLIAIVSASFGNIISNQKQNEVFEKLRFIHDKLYLLSDKEKYKLEEHLSGKYFYQLKTTIQTEAQESLEVFNKAKLEKLEIMLTETKSKQFEMEKKIQMLLEEKPILQNKIENAIKEAFTPIQENYPKINNSLNKFQESITNTTNFFDKLMNSFTSQHEKHGSVLIRLADIQQTFIEKFNEMDIKFEELDKKLNKKTDTHKIEQESFQLPNVKLY